VYFQWGMTAAMLFFAGGFQIYAFIVGSDSFKPIFSDQLSGALSLYPSSCDATVSLAKAFQLVAFTGV